MPPSAVLCVRLCSGGKIVWFQGCIQISLKSHNSGFTCRSQKRFSLFYSSSKALSDDISLTWNIKTAFNPFWWRQLSIWHFASNKNLISYKTFEGWFGPTVVNTYFFMDWKIFLTSSSYFSLIVITIIFYHAECVDGRQPRILVDNLWIPRSKHVFHSRVSRRRGRASVITFFPINTSFFLFFFKVLVFSRYLWIFTSNISPHFAEFAGIKLAIISPS